MAGTRGSGLTIDNTRRLPHNLDTSAPARVCALYSAGAFNDDPSETSRVCLYDTSYDVIPPKLLRAVLLTPKFGRVILRMWGETKQHMRGRERVRDIRMNGVKFGKVTHGRGRVEKFGFSFSIRTRDADRLWTWSRVKTVKFFKL